MFDIQPERFGHVWTSPEVPTYLVNVDSDLADTKGSLSVTTRSYDGTETLKADVPTTLKKGMALQEKPQFPVKLNGSHDIEAVLDIGGKKWAEKRSFVRLAPDTRAERWTEGKGALFGYWSYHGGHHTPKAEHHIG